MATVKEIFALVVQADVAGGANAIRTFATGAKKDLHDVETSSGQMYAALARGGAQVAAAGAAGLAALMAMGLSARKAAGEVVALQRVSGGTAEEVSKIRFAAQQTGVDLDALSTGMVRLSRNASTDKGAEVLARYGIEAKDSEGKVRPLGDLLSEIAGVVKALPNGAEKNDLVVSIFGRGGAQLLPLLNRGADGLEQLGVKAGEFGAVLDGKTLESAKRYTAAQRDMNAAVAGLRESIGSDVLPTLTSANEAVASVASGAAKEFESLPEGFRQTAVSAGLAVSGIASVGGTIASTVGSYGMAALGAQALTASFGSLGAGMAAIAAPAAAAAAALGSWLFVITELNNQQRETVDLQTVTADRIAQAGTAASAASRRSAAADIAAQLAKGQEVGPVTVLDRAKNVFGAYDDTPLRAKLAASALEQVKTAISDLPASQAKAALDGIGAEMRRMGASAAEVKTTLGPLYAQLGQTSDVDAGAEAMKRYADAVDKAAAKGITLQEALAGLKDGVDPGELTVYADTLDQTFSVVDSAASAWDRLQEAQRAASRGAKRDTSEIESAYKRLGDAKRSLDELLNGGPDGLKQVSPESQIADARARVVEADQALVANPKDGAALAKRDEALADENRAIQRRQEIRRELGDAQQAVKDAQSDVASAKKRADEKAAEDQTKTAKDLRDAQSNYLTEILKFGDAVTSGRVNASTFATQLQQLVDAGLLPQPVKDAYMAKLGDLTTQAGLAAAALQRIAATPPPAGATGAPGVPGSNVYGPPAPNTVSRSFVGPLAPGQSYQNRPAPGAAAVGPDPLGAIRALPAKPYTEGENRIGVPAEVQRLVNAADWGSLIDIMSKRKAKFPGFQYGGIVGGSGGTDSQLIRATPGEGVVNPAGMRLLGHDGLARINRGQSAAPVVVRAGDTVTENNSYTLVAPSPRLGAQAIVASKRRARMLAGERR